MMKETDKAKSKRQNLLREILQILEGEARTTPEQLATMTNQPVDKVVKAIKQAEETGIVVKYKTMINWEKLGEEPIRALIEIKLQPQREVGFDAIAERIARFSQTHSVYLVSGAYDLAVLVTGKSMQEVADFVAQKLAPLEGVQGTATHFLLKRYKEDGELLMPEETAQRLPITL
jgi:DNA-binding Lrp family transcriptional regulator